MPPLCSDITKPVTAEEARMWFAERMKRRPDCGIGNAALNWILWPRTPFDPQARRKFRGEFLFVLGWLLTAAAAFLYFNFAR